MAIIKLSPLVDSISQSLGGTTFCQTRAQLVCKTKANRTNMQTAKLSTQKMRVAQAFYAWRNLNSGDRLLWSNYAATNFQFRANNSFLPISAYAEFLRVRLPAYIAGSYVDPVVPVPQVIYTLLDDGISNSYTSPASWYAESFWDIVDGGDTPSMNWYLWINLKAGTRLPYGRPALINFFGSAQTDENWRDYFNDYGFVRLPGTTFIVAAQACAGYPITQCSPVFYQFFDS